MPRYKNKQTGEIVEAFCFSMNHNPQWFIDMQREGKVGVDYKKMTINLAFDIDLYVKPNQEYLSEYHFDFGYFIIRKDSGKISIWQSEDFNNVFSAKLPEESGVPSEPLGCKYRLKGSDEIVDAFPFNVITQYPDWFMNGKNSRIEIKGGKIRLESNANNMPLKYGDYIYKTQVGNVYSMSPDLFEKRFERVIDIPDRFEPYGKVFRVSNEFTKITPLPIKENKPKNYLKVFGVEYMNKKDVENYVDDKITWLIRYIGGILDKK